MQYDDEATASAEFEWFIESISIVLPNCDEWIKQNMQFVSTTQLFIKSQMTILELANHFGIPNDKVRTSLLKIWKSTFPSPAI